MREVDIVQKNDVSVNKTVNFRKLLGSRVISTGGLVVGRVKEIRVDPKTMNLQGIFVSRGMFKAPLYVGKSYFDKVSDNAAMLNIDPFVLLIGKKVISLDGRKIGKVEQITRSDNTNEIESVIVGRMFKKFSIPVDSIKMVGKSIILKISYDGTKKYIH